MFLYKPSTNRSLGSVNLTTSTNWWRPIRSSELHSIYIHVYIPLKTINQFELNTCWIANVYVLNILSYNEIMKYFSISYHTCTKYTNIHTSCPHFQASTPVQISLSSTLTSAKLDDQIIGTKKTCWSDQQNLMDFSCQIQAKTKHKNLIVPVC